MQDRPTAIELLDAVRGFLEHDVQGAVDGRVAFLTRVAVNVVGIVMREMEQGDAADAAQRARLVELLGHDGTTRALEEELVAEIRSGALDNRHDEVLEHVRATVNEKLLVDNPRYLDSSGG